MRYIRPVRFVSVSTANIFQTFPLAITGRITLTDWNTLNSYSTSTYLILGTSICSASRVSSKSRWHNGKLKTETLPIGFETAHGHRCVPIKRRVQHCSSAEADFGERYETLKGNGIEVEGSELGTPEEKVGVGDAVVKEAGDEDGTEKKDEEQGEHGEKRGEK
ncbi:MAG: hypothetical protein Q9167_005963 [Letrouitia subvulpina]